MKNSISQSNLLKNILTIKAQEKKGSFLPIVKYIHNLGPKITSYSRKYTLPFYLIDHKSLLKSIVEFKSAFDKHLPGHQAFYAMKANYHPHILKTVVEKGLGIDVSSGRELTLAIKAGAKKILFSGPGKSDEEIGFGIQYSDSVIFNLDSLLELKRVAALAKKAHKKVRAGIRFFSSYHGAWSKFGIPLTDLRKFWGEAQKYSSIILEGIQFHTSMNINPQKNQAILEELANFLEKNFSQTELAEIKFIDVGGGYYPDAVEGYYPWSHQYPWTLSSGHFLKLANEYYGKEIKFKDKYYITRTANPETFAKALSKTIEKKLRKLLLNASYYTEPGRIVCNNSTHLVMKVMDVKNNVVITDGGINMTGWEFGLNFYYPIINLTNTSNTEKAYRIYGSLCTPRDFWGYYMFAKKVAPGDLIVIPNQGAYRFTLAQEFIKPIPNTYILK